MGVPPFLSYALKAKTAKESLLLTPKEKKNGTSWIPLFMLLKLTLFCEEVINRVGIGVVPHVT